MCYSNCLYENWDGECTLSPIQLHPCAYETDEEYKEATKEHQADLIAYEYPESDFAKLHSNTGQ